MSDSTLSILIYTMPTSFSPPIYLFSPSCPLLIIIPIHCIRAIFQEAYNILPSGGALSLMDMNPRSEFFQKFASNPFAFAAFKSTEPWIQEYVSMDLESTLAACGFSGVTVLANSPRHRTVVAYKK
jgi:hypothetical protein